MYLFRVCTVCGEKKSGWNETKEEALGIKTPSIISAEATSWHEILLVYEGVKGASYELKGESPLKAEPDVIKIKGTGIVKLNDLQPDTEYSFWIRAGVEAFKSLLGSVYIWTDWSEVSVVKTLSAPAFSDLTWSECPQTTNTNLLYYLS